MKHVIPVDDHTLSNFKWDSGLRLHVRLLGGDCALEPLVHGIVLEKVLHVVQIHEGIINCNHWNLDIAWQPKIQNYRCYACILETYMQWHALMICNVTCQNCVANLLGNSRTDWMCACQETLWFSTAARKTRRPIRPKPLIPIVVMATSGLQVISHVGMLDASNNYAARARKKFCYAWKPSCAVFGPKPPFARAEKRVMGNGICRNRTWIQLKWWQFLKSPNCYDLMVQQTKRWHMDKLWVVNCSWFNFDFDTCMICSWLCQPEKLHNVNLRNGLFFPSHSKNHAILLYLAESRTTPKP